MKVLEVLSAPDKVIHKEQATMQKKTPNPKMYTESPVQTPNNKQNT